MVPTWGWPGRQRGARRPRTTPDQDQPTQPGRAAGLALARHPAARPPRRGRTTEGDPGCCELDADRSRRARRRPATVFEGYQAIAARHQHALNRLRNARQILFRANVGRVPVRAAGRRHARTRSTRCTPRSATPTSRPTLDPSRRSSSCRSRRWTRVAGGAARASCASRRSSPGRPTRRGVRDGRRRRLLPAPGARACIDLSTWVGDELRRTRVGREPSKDLGGTPPSGTGTASIPQDQTRRAEGLPATRRTPGAEADGRGDRRHGRRARRASRRSSRRGPAEGRATPPRSSLTPCSSWPPRTGVPAPASAAVHDPAGRVDARGAHLDVRRVGDEHRGQPRRGLRGADRLHLAARPDSRGVRDRQADKTHMKLEQGVDVPDAARSSGSRVQDKDGDGIKVMRDVLTGWDAPGIDIDSPDAPKRSDIISGRMTSFSFGADSLEHDPLAKGSGSTSRGRSSTRPRAARGCSSRSAGSVEIEQKISDRWTFAFKGRTDAGAAVLIGGPKTFRPAAGRRRLALRRGTRRPSDASPHPTRSPDKTLHGPPRRQHPHRHRQPRLHADPRLDGRRRGTRGGRATPRS